MATNALDDTRKNTYAVNKYIRKWRIAMQLYRKDLHLFSLAVCGKMYHCSVSLFLLTVVTKENRPYLDLRPHLLVWINFVKIIRFSQIFKFFLLIWPLNITSGQRSFLARGHSKVRKWVGWGIKSAIFLIFKLWFGK